MEQAFKIGNVVGIPTSIILSNISEIITRLQYSLRPEIYGVVNTIKDNGDYGITWAIDGLLDMGKVMKDKLNEKGYNKSDLVLIIGNNNEDSGEIMYVNNFFTYGNNIKQWEIYDWTMNCETVTTC